MLSPGHEAKSDNLPRKLQAAMDYAINICALGADNKIVDIEETNGWTLYPKYRYNTAGRYLKYPDHGLNFSTAGDNYNNILFDNQNRKLAVKIKNTNYDRHPASGNITPKLNNIKWYYHCDDIANINNINIYLHPVRQDENPLLDPQFALSPLATLLNMSLFTIDKRQGNCGERACLVSKYLWEHSAGIHKIEIIAMTTVDHCFVVVNRSGNLQDPSTWGNGCWVIDAWYKNKGCLFPASEFKDKIKEIEQFLQDQAIKLKPVGISTRPSPPDPSGNLYRCDFEIQPDKDCYPTHSNRPIDDFYDVLNAYRGIYPDVTINSSPNLFSALQKDKESHQAKFKGCLKEIESAHEKTQNQEGLKTSTTKNVVRDQTSTSNPSPPPEKSLFAEVMEYHQRLFDEQKKCCLGFFRRTKINANCTPQSLLDHALGKRNRSNQVLRFFGIIKKNGTVDHRKKAVFLGNDRGLKKF